MATTRVSRRVQVRPGDLAVAPRVDDPRGFAIANRSERALVVSFRYDAEAHIQTVVVEEPRPARRPPRELQHGDPPPH